MTSETVAGASPTALHLTSAPISSIPAAAPAAEHAPQALTDDNTKDSRPKIPRPTEPVTCPRCGSGDTKFCYFNNYNPKQPRYFCKSCQRYWTSGGTLRNVPVGAGKRKRKYNARDGDRSGEDDIPTLPTVSVSSGPALLQHHALHQHSLVHQPEAVQAQGAYSLPPAPAVPTAASKLAAPQAHLPANFFFGIRPAFATGPAPGAASTTAANGWPTTDVRLQPLGSVDAARGAAASNASAASAMPQPDRVELPGALSKQPAVAAAEAATEHQAALGSTDRHGAAQAGLGSPLQLPAAQVQGPSPLFRADSTHTALPGHTPVPSDWPSVLQHQSEGAASDLGEATGTPTPLPSVLHPQASHQGLGSSHGFQPFSSAANGAPYMGAKPEAKPGPHDWFSMAAAAGQQQAAAHFMHLQQAQMQQAAAFQLQMQAAAAANWTSGSKPYMANVPAVWPMNVGVHPYNHPWPAAGFHQVGAVPAGWASPDALANGGSATASGLTAMPGALTRASWGTAPHAAQAPGDSFTAATHTPGLYATETLVRSSDASMHGAGLFSSAAHQSGYLAHHNGLSSEPHANSPFSAYSSFNGHYAGHRPAAMQSPDNSAGDAFSGVPSGWLAPPMGGHSSATGGSLQPSAFGSLTAHAGLMQRQSSGADASPRALGGSPLHRSLSQQGSGQHVGLLS